MARRSSPKPFQRTDRIGELIREIVASELERIGDERLEMVTVTGVKVEGSLDNADVFYSAFSAEADGRIDEVEVALEHVRWPIQVVVNRQVRARRTPQIHFRRDDVLLGALRIEELLHEVADAPPVPPGTGGVGHDDAEPGGDGEPGSGVAGSDPGAAGTGDEGASGAGDPGTAGAGEGPGPSGSPT
jgi:ribosome-binding factor A